MNLKIKLDFFDYYFNNLKWSRNQIINENAQKLQSNSCFGNDDYLFFLH